jgi:dipeptidyl aminopeptidase/acylaminoacyl peptidase
MTSDTGSFRDMDGYLRIPRVNDLALSPTGDRLVATVSQFDGDAHTFVESLWQIDPAGQSAARRLTWSDKGESGPVFTPDGSLLFRSRRAGEDDDSPPALWQLPPTGGEARKVLSRAGGVGGVIVARDAGTVVIVTPRFADSKDDKQDAERRKVRKDAKVGAVLYESSPIRYWDHDLGPDALHLLLVPSLDEHDGDEDPTRDLTPDPGRSLLEQTALLTPDGTAVVTGWAEPDGPGYDRAKLVVIDVADGSHRVLAADPALQFAVLDISRDGRRAVCIAETDQSIELASERSLWLVDLGSGERTELVHGSDLLPSSAAFSVDGSAVFVTSDDHGHARIFRIDLASGDVVRVTRSGHYTSVCVAPDGVTLYALRDHVDSPPVPVRIDATAVDGDAVPLRAPGSVEIPGRLEDVSVTVEDGTVVRSWLVLPTEASAQAPAPLVLWMHGGPISSWNSWSWRWNPWLLAARGYAVLLPDPALSTGYGQSMIQRGWGQWGGAPYTDLMAATDDVVARDDIDETRTAAMGGSYGGYLANWVAGHTDRFRCLVTHASLWAIDQFQGTTDMPAYWAKEWGMSDEAPEQYATWSPHRFLDDIRTPMLVVHGDKDYRVPIGEGLRLWWDLQRKGVESKYLYFPDEGHWVMKPDNARIWYETVLAWLATYIRDEDWQRPSLL